MKQWGFLLLFCFLLLGCGEKASSQSSNEQLENQIETPFWNDGKAEIATYELVQNRYNSEHPGSVTMVFVTEDFLTDKQVKNESYTSQNTTKVLKNIQIRKFTTGVYDYNLHTSVFTPLDRSNFKTLKVTNSMQEWCGTTFRQLNNRNNKYHLQVRSYFESEGDQDLELDNVILEDEFFNLIRMNPKLLPIGEVEFIPSLSFLSLLHIAPKVETGIFSNTKYAGKGFEGEDLMSFTFIHQSQERMVEIVYENEAPHKIVGFTESYPSAFDGIIRKTIATLKTTKRLKYWELNKPTDIKLRKELGL